MRLPCLLVIARARARARGINRGGDNKTNGKTRRETKRDISTFQRQTSQKCPLLLAENLVDRRNIVGDDRLNDKKSG